MVLIWKTKKCIVSIHHLQTLSCPCDIDLALYVHQVNGNSQLEIVNKQYCAGEQRHSELVKSLGICIRSLILGPRIVEVQGSPIDRSFARKIRPFFLSKFSLRIPCQETCWNRLRLGACWKLPKISKWRNFSKWRIFYTVLATLWRYDALRWTLLCTKVSCYIKGMFIVRDWS